FSRDWSSDVCSSDLLYFAKVRGQRSYCVSFRVPGVVPQSTFISVDGPTRSIRPVSAADGPAGTAQLVVGGGGHPVGRSGREIAEIGRASCRERAAEE